MSFLDIEFVIKALIKDGIKRHKVLSRLIIVIGCLKQVNSHLYECYAANSSMMNRHRRKINPTLAEN